MRPRRLFNPIVPLVTLALFAPLTAGAAGSEAPTPQVALRPFAAETSGAPGMQLAIAAIVNDEVISGFDLDQRVRLIVGASGVEANPEEMQRIRAQILRSLIDEKLKYQEAKRLKVEVKDKEIVDQLTYVAQRNNMTVDDVKKELRQQGVSIFTLTDQIKVDLAWNMLVQGRFGSDVKISNEEVARIMNEMRSNSDKPQYAVLEIFLAVDSPSEDAKVKQQAKDLIEQVRQGRQFGQVAQSFSQSASAANGGEIGWVMAGQLPTELDNWIRRAHRGEMSVEPIHTLAGYYILGIRDTRNVATGPSSAQTPLILKRIFVPLDAYASASTSKRVRDQLEAAAATVHGCEKLNAIASSVPNAKVIDIGTRRLADLQPELRPLVASLVTGTATREAVRTNAGWDVIVLCGHAEEQTAEPTNLPTEQDVKEQLFEQQISMLSRRYLRDLRRDAVIDSRIAEQ